jgi:hypothetical protein
LRLRVQAPVPPAKKILFFRHPLHFLGAIMSEGRRSWSSPYHHMPIVQFSLLFRVTLISGSKFSQLETVAKWNPVELEHWMPTNIKLLH